MDPHSSVVTLTLIDDGNGIWKHLFSHFLVFPIVNDGCSELASAVLGGCTQPASTGSLVKLGKYQC